MHRVSERIEQLGQVALKTWDKDNLLRLHGDVPFHTDPWHGNTSLKTMLDGSRSWSTNYYMGHVVGYAPTHVCMATSIGISWRYAHRHVMCTGGALAVKWLQ